MQCLCENNHIVLEAPDVLVELYGYCKLDIHTVVKVWEFLCFENRSYYTSYSMVHNKASSAEVIIFQKNINECDS